MWIHTALNVQCTQNLKPSRIYDRFVWSMQIAWMQLFNVYVHTTNLLFPFSLLLPSPLLLCLCRCRYRCECSSERTIKCFRTHFRYDVTMQFLYECLKKCHFQTGEREKKEIKWKRSESNKATTMTKTATTTVVRCNKMSMMCVLRCVCSVQCVYEFWLRTVKGYTHIYPWKMDGKAKLEHS